MKRFLAGASMLAMIAGLLSIAAAQAAPDKSHSQSSQILCGEGFVTYAPTTVWPPNHKMKTITVVYTDDEDDGPEEITVTAKGHDEILADLTEMNGSGPPNPKDG